MSKAKNLRAFRHAIETKIKESPEASFVFVSVNTSGEFPSALTGFFGHPDDVLPAAIATLERYTEEMVEAGSEACQVHAPVLARVRAALVVLADTDDAINPADTIGATAGQA